MSPYKPLDIAALHHKSRHQGLLQPDECAQASANIAAGWKLYVAIERALNEMDRQGEGALETLIGTELAEQLEHCIDAYEQTVTPRPDLMEEPSGGQFPCPEWWDLSGTQDS